MESKNTELNNWVNDITNLVKPKKVVWCDGSAQEYDRLVEEMLQSKTLYKLNPEKNPNCYLHRSDPNDVARTEHLTYVCTTNKEDVGPNNNWMPPQEAHDKIDSLFANSMQERTMYILLIVWAQLTLHTHAVA